MTFDRSGTSQELHVRRLPSLEDLKREVLAFYTAKDPTILAVNKTMIRSYVRHNYTNYDAILKRLPRGRGGLAYVTVRDRLNRHISSLVDDLYATAHHP